MPCQLLLVRFEKHEHADERIETGIDRRQRLHGLEDEGPVMRGRMRIHIALVEPHVPLRLLRVSVLPRDLRLVVNAAGDGSDEEKKEEAGRPAEPAITPDFGGVLDRDGQDPRGDHCLAVVAGMEY